MLLLILCCFKYYRGTILFIFSSVVCKYVKNISRIHTESSMLVVRLKPK